MVKIIKTPDEQPNDAIERDLVTALYDDSFGGVLVSIACASALFLIFGDDPVLGEFKLYWFIAFMLLLTIRLLDTSYWHKNLRGTSYAFLQAKRRFISMAALSSFAWTTYAITIVDHASWLELSMTIIILASLAGGSATVLSGNRTLGVCYSFLLIFPMSFLMAIGEDPNKNVLGYLGLFFSLIMILGSWRTAAFTRNAIVTKNQNTDFVKALADKNEEILAVNADLENKVRLRTKEIFELSNIDPLTGLFNRTAFSKSLGDIISLCQSQARGFALLFIDLDGFKAINDTQGHNVGDKVLVAIAQRITLFANGAGHVCRWGGDEFIVVIEDLDEGEAVEFGRDLIASLSQHIKVDSNKLSVGATIGVAMYPRHGSDETELISLADTAMYIQKEKNKADVSVFTHEMRQSQIREQQIKEGLALALQKNEFHLVYQPVIDNESKEVSFCEVLLRWRYRGEMVPPHEFIPIAEQYGFIHDIGEWVLMEACRESSSWIFDDHVNISVNVSVSQLVRADFIAIVQNALVSSGFSASNLHLEITESMFESNVDMMLERIRALQGLGIKVSVDDFGTGFSSLSQLQKLSADIVKIDRSFISSMATGGQAIIQATQYIAKELGYSVVAEGVETKAQADELADIGIQCSQGYYFSYPMPIAELTDWYQKFKKS
ncbi:EAL domain-containing protein [Glaciecola sp. MH2013]|uniref:putative bifunctional diguanylate cyclase/phosphodiesterase n=1 Tax=Glaciecola sp. MH2013 TaxID=2785524 RepID=UPI0018A0F5F8|nr:EAL domain-containing protein [Glaciecola sp. MH2013]MBF7073082.1 EAL domain-containing protein [Glaciecola sp. MH2013]